VKTSNLTRGWNSLRPERRRRRKKRRRRRRRRRMVLQLKVSVTL
jgi:hypothetical protein